jgi:uncharacterized protein with HEPN domain
VTPKPSRRSADLIVIGEAAGRIPPEVMSAHPDVPWQRMKGMRNWVVHVYFDVDPKVLWDTIQHDLPPLIEPLRELREKDV